MRAYCYLNLHARNHTEDVLVYCLSFALRSGASLCALSCTMRRLMKLSQQHMVLTTT